MRARERERESEFAAGYSSFFISAHILFVFWAHSPSPFLFSIDSILFCLSRFSWLLSPRQLDEPSTTRPPSLPRSPSLPFWDSPARSRDFTTLDTHLPTSYDRIRIRLDRC